MHNLIVTVISIMSKALPYILQYTLRIIQKNTHAVLQSFCDNFGRCGQILIILSLLHSEIDSGRSCYIICHLTSDLLQVAALPCKI